MATYGHQGGGWMNADQREAMRDKALAKMPTKPGFYWARWTSPARGTHEGGEMAYPQDWGVVEVWENFIGDPCEADRCEKFAVGIPGVRETQWLENFQWDVGPSGRPEPIPEPGCEG